MKKLKMEMNYLVRDDASDGVSLELRSAESQGILLPIPRMADRISLLRPLQLVQ